VLLSFVPEKIFGIELSLKIDVVCERIIFFGNLIVHLHHNFNPKLWKNEKIIAIA